jgi:hypothetical protein
MALAQLKSQQAVLLDRLDSLDNNYNIEKIQCRHDPECLLNLLERYNDKVKLVETKLLPITKRIMMMEGIEIRGNLLNDPSLGKKSYNKKNKSSRRKRRVNRSRSRKC